MSWKEGPGDSADRAVSMSPKFLVVRQVVGVPRGRGRKKRFAASRKVSQIADEKAGVAMTRSWSWMTSVSLSVDDGRIVEASGWNELDC